MARFKYVTRGPGSGSDQVSYQKVLLFVAGFVLVLGSGIVAYDTSLRAGIDVARDLNTRRLQIFDRTLEANIERFHYLPATISNSTEIRALLENPDSPSLRARANGFLSNLNSTAVSDELFVVDRTGQSVAASNWWSHVSLVGHSYAIRPYFIESMLDGAAKYYAVGLTTSVPGYFLADRIEGPDGPLGVAVVKINLGEIEAVWWRSGELIGIFDLNDVAILSTRPDWRYRPFSNIGEDEVARLNSDQRYAGLTLEGEGIVQSITPWRDTELAVLRSPDAEVSGEFMVDRLRIPSHGWQLLSFTPVGPILSNAWRAALVVGVAVAASLSAMALFAQRQRLIRARLDDHGKLEDRVRLRTIELQETNLRLSQEILERQQVEKEREDAQRGLVQAAKLASLGQALAGVAHEVSQPIAALRIQTSSAKLMVRGRLPELMDLLGSMDAVLGRLTALTGHLKTFARKATEISIRSDVVHIVHNACELAQHLTETGRIHIALDAPEDPLTVIGNPIYIEQVLINLISNAADAMEGVEHPLLSIRVVAGDGIVTLRFADVGTGIDPAVAETLFDPFVTTKEPGKGLGLGLSISYGLIREMGGSIQVESRSGVGTTFIIILPLAADEAAMEAEST